VGHAVKQWEMTSLLCAHCSLKNWKIAPFRTGNRAGARVRSFDFEKKHDKWKHSHGARLQKQQQTALIVSVTFI
jgi:hypothetical protein